MTTSLAALKKLALKATRGPWIVDRQDFISTKKDYVERGCLIEITLEPHNFAKDEDASFVAAASPDVILSLIEKLEVAEARIKKLEDALEFYTQLPEMTVGNRVYKQLHLKALEALKEK